MNKPKILALTILLALLFLQSAYAVNVKTDPRVELFSIIFYLAGNKEYSRCQIPDYKSAIDRNFSEFKNHSVVALAKKVCNENGVSYDAVMDAAVALTSIDCLQPVIGLDKEFIQIDTRWKREDLEAFYQLLEDFVQKTKFKDFFASHKHLYSSIEKNLQELLAGHSIQNWFDKSFPKSDAEFLLIPACVNGPSCYGPGLIVDGKAKSFCILGVYRFNESGACFSDNDLHIIFHEFCHSHTNPLVERHYPKMEAAMQKLFKYGEKEFADQAYPKPQTVAYETFVRACTAAYLNEYHSESAYLQHISENEKQRFFWIRPLAEEILRLRRENITIEAELDRLIAVLTDYAANADRNIAAIKQKWAERAQEIARKSPTIVKANINDGDVDVSTDIEILTIKFNRKMRCDSFALMNHRDSPEFTGKAAFKDDQMTFSIPLKLEPERQYVIQLNGEEMLAFADTEGNPLMPTRISFSTRKFTEEEKKAIEMRRPKIVSLSPANGAENVSPAVNEIRIEFNLPMKQQWSLVGGGKTFPEITGELKLNASGTVLTVPVKLAPEQKYDFWVNSERYQSIESLEGLKLIPVRYEFKTGK